MSILSNFAENLKELMLEHNLNAPALAKKLNIHRTNVTRYMRGERLPTFPVLVGILLLFNCSADILLGLRMRTHWFLMWICSILLLHVCFADAVLRFVRIIRARVSSSGLLV